MAGILDFLGSGSRGGILGQGAFTPQPAWASKVGLIGATLADVGAQLGGHPADATNTTRYAANNQNRQQIGALMSALNSDDPAMRQKAYSIMPLLGVDPKQFQAQQVSAAMPHLINNMQPQLAQQQVTPGISAPGLPQMPGATPLNDPARQAINSQAPTYQPTLSQALMDTGNPELDAQMGPEIIKDNLDRQSKAVHTFSLDEAKAAGLDPTGTYQGDRNGKITVVRQPTTMTPYQKAEVDNQGANLKVAQDRLGMDQAKAQAGIPNDDALHDMATRYVHGDKTAFGSMGRNPLAQTAANNMISQVGKELGYTPQQISQNQQTFQAGTKAVSAFDTGKQGDTVRSLNVSVSHLETLRELGAALDNGDIRLINAAKQKFAEEFGVPAPTNFDAAKSIVADEVAKGVIGGQSAQSDRETLAASLRRTGGPSAINGAISTFQDLLGGQLRGLRQQYKSSTGREDFNDKLFPGTLSALDRGEKKPPAKMPPSPPKPAASAAGWSNFRQH